MKTDETVSGGEVDACKLHKMRHWSCRKTTAAKQTAEKHQKGLLKSFNYNRQSQKSSSLVKGVEIYNTNAFGLTLKNMSASLWILSVSVRPVWPTKIFIWAETTAEFIKLSDIRSSYFGFTMDKNLNQYKTASSHQSQSIPLHSHWGGGAEPTSPSWTELSFYNYHLHLLHISCLNWNKHLCPWFCSVIGL